MKRILIPFLPVLVALLLWPETQLPAASGGTVKGSVNVTKKIFNKKRPKKDRSNIVVFLENLSTSGAGITKTINQRRKKFLPRVLPIVKGSVVKFLNSDPFNHNVFSPTDGNTFDLDYMGLGGSKQVRFSKTGSIRIYCNIHSAMIADILVVPNRYFAKTNRAGRYQIGNIPPGKYTFVAWQPLGAAERRNIVVKPGGTTTLNFDIEETIFSIKHKNKYGKSYAKEY